MEGLFRLDFLSRDLRMGPFYIIINTVISIITKLFRLCWNLSLPFFVI